MSHDDFCVMEASHIRCPYCGELLSERPSAQAPMLQLTTKLENGRYRNAMYTTIGLHVDCLEPWCLAEIELAVLRTEADADLDLPKDQACHIRLPKRKD